MGNTDQAGGDARQRGHYNWRFEIIVACLGLGGAAILIAVDDLQNADVLEGAAQWGGIIGTLLLAYLVTGIILVQRSWETTPKNHDPGTEEQPRYRAAFAWLVGYLAVLAWAAFGHDTAVNAFPWDFALAGNPQHQMLFGALLAAGFIPLLFGFHLVAVEATENTGRKNYLSDPDEEVSWLTLTLTFGVCLLVGIGAWAAGQRLFTMSDNFGLMAVGAVVASFLLFIVAANILGFREPRQTGDAPRKAAAGGMTQSASEMVVALDAALVRLVAPLSGATLPGTVSGKIAIVCVLLPLSALGFALPAPVGLFPIGFAILLILSIGRRWSWVEDDREKALRLQTTRSDKFRIGFNNDMRDEALLGYAFLFVLVPLGLRQIQLHFEFFAPHQLAAARAAASSASIIDWLNFFGGELAKGVPIVDWFDIYDIQQERPFEPKDASGRHVIFASRLMIDIVIIAALLQAIGIMQRNKGQENLFKSGQVDFFDPFMEKKILSAAYQKPKQAGDAPLTMKWLKFFEAHRDKSRDLDRGDFYYNPRRLNELSADFAETRSTSDHRIKAVVDWLSEDLVVGSISERLEKIVELYSDLQEREGCEDPDAQSLRRRIERFIDDLIFDFREMPSDKLTQAAFKRLSQLLFVIEKDRGLDVQRNRAFWMLGDKAELNAARVLAGRIIDGAQAAGVMSVAEDEVQSWYVKRQGRQIDRTAALEQLVGIFVASEPATADDQEAYARLLKDASKKRLSVADQKRLAQLRRKGAGTKMTAAELDTFKRLYSSVAGIVIKS
ncbi:MAG: hypothetical protein FP825_13880 [Hyphomonas sp.]|uniref:hypothetical protein n=1 Tax=Hyphomonas sp. TaxID=87 RepID=UPI00179028BC|nr:hypothetical protein [Hyphomonas sp.]MBA3069557.1 hypothetical protein [Hyphomonas sp.]MBU3919085.1 hypothetical protein [Alphaproteobacteria bacterium]MBU4063282.1 hypothetical protein [Alphaproteobacteria bacterium]MBU4164100.1 hypothetical protein [Alphaproteobacteria bacterium]